MPKRLLFIIGFICFVGCSPKTPADILSAEKMTIILTDLQLADAAYKLDLLPPGYKGHPEKYYLEILSTNQTDSASYNRSMHFYAENPKLLKKIFLEVEKNVQNHSSVK